MGPLGSARKTDFFVRVHEDVPPHEDGVAAAAAYRFRTNQGLLILRNRFPRLAAEIEPGKVIKTLVILMFKAKVPK